MKSRHSNGSVGDVAALMICEGVEMLKQNVVNMVVRRNQDGGFGVKRLFRSFQSSAYSKKTVWSKHWAEACQWVINRKKIVVPYVDQDVGVAGQLSILKEELRGHVS